MWKKNVALGLLLSLLLPSFLWPEAPFSSAERLKQIAGELEEIQKSRERCLLELENTNSERRLELEERLNELSAREAELKQLRQQLALFGNLIDDQAIYTRKLEKSLLFWRITSGILAASLTTALLIRGASN